MTLHSSILVKERSELIFIQPAWMNVEGFLWINRCSVLCGILSLIFLGKWTRNINLSDKQFSTTGKKCWNQPLNLVFTWAEESQKLQFYLDSFENSLPEKTVEVPLLVYNIFRFAILHIWASEQKRKNSELFNTPEETCFLLCGRDKMACLVLKHMPLHYLDREILKKHFNRLQIEVIMLPF